VECTRYSVWRDEEVKTDALCLLFYVLGMCWPVAWYFSREAPRREEMQQEIVDCRATVAKMERDMERVEEMIKYACRMEDH
jgi:hypothetical protein